jgi:predicted anti-sigma-YlaC factor YlaD
MRRRTLPEHPKDEAILAYLDGEMSRVQARPILNHLKSCWECRSVLADLETQAETISRLLSARQDSDIGRSAKAKERFFRWRTSFERQRRAFFRIRRSLLRNPLHVALAQ